MKNFRVKIQNTDGSSDYISIKAETASEAVDLAGSRGYNAVEAIPDETRAGISSGRVPDAELYHFTRLFATLTRAGIPILETLELLVSRVDNQNLKNALRDIFNNVNDGNGIRASFAKHPLIFDKSYLQLIEVGEES